MKKPAIVIAAALAALALCSCTTGNAERDKNIAKVERKGWDIVDAFTTVLTDVATRRAAELGNPEAGLRK